ncbi:MAG: hypothetical protein IKF97_05735 [Clostridia bacterium]|nr:hypothetical protein [Clostridia bacterium]
MEKQEKDEIFEKVILDAKNENIKKLIKGEKASPFLDNAGLVISLEKKRGKEIIHFVGEDFHALNIGSTRSRKDKADLFYKQHGLIRTKSDKVFYLQTLKESYLNLQINIIKILAMK